MEKKNDNSSTQTGSEQQPGDMSSFNNRDTGRKAETEDVKKEGKDESESYMDYNGNSEQNAPARSR